MAQLMFIADSHEYRLDGEQLPSVSEVIRFISREVYGDIAQFRVDNAADRGTKVHKATEVLDKYGEVEVDPGISGYLKAYVGFRREHDCDWQRIEYASANIEQGYAGTIDRYGFLDGHKVIMDIKTSYNVHKVMYGAQQNLYRMLMESNGYEVEKLIILHLKPDGTYKLIELPIEDEIAMACLTLHKALQKKRRKKNGVK